MSAPRRTYDYGYNVGVAAGIQQEAGATRVKAFGAIRRAAEVAREFDERGIWDPELWITADAIRIAIRAAIGSEKTW